MNALPFVFQGSHLDIVADNARSHLCGRMMTKPQIFGDERVTATYSDRQSDKARCSRWECTSVKKDHVPVIKSLRASPCLAASSESRVSLCNVLKPVRRRSLENYYDNKHTQIMERFHDWNTSFCSLDGVMEERDLTASMIARALQTMDIFDAGFDDEMDDHS